MLDTETVTSFTSGVYLQWAVSGNLLITFTNVPGSSNAVLSGLFLDPATTSAAATYLKQDTTTQGNWIGTYGSQGYDLINGTSSLPSYATVTPAGESNYTWSTTTTDPRALEDAGGSGRIAATWFGSSFTVDVNLTDGQTHDLELYFLDWDTTSRAEQVQISNASTGAVLDTETVTSFSSGVYLQWAVKGNLLITFTNQPGSSDAVLSGLFLDPATTSAAATYLKQDTTTQGNWIGTYGSQGYDLINGTSSLPSYATVTPAGELNFTWSTTTTDPRALEDAGGSGRIAATWFGSSFTVDVNLTDGQTHDLELYFLDWDTTSRAEQVQISNASTGAVLDTETVTSFTSGVYLQWAVKGNLLITFINQPGSSDAVLSGLFLDPATTSAAATYLKQDTTTQGNWIGTYGSQGYDLINGTSSLPSYATVTPAGELNFTWSTTTTDPRARGCRRLRPHRRHLVRVQLHRRRELDRWSDSRPGVVFPRLGHHLPCRAGTDQQRLNRRGTRYRDGHVVHLGRLSPVGRQREPADHVH